MFKVDTHVHTAEISPCSHLYSDEIVEYYKKAGYDGIVITDHFNGYIFRGLAGNTWEEKVDEYIKGYEAVKAEGEKVGLRVFFGMELKTPENNNEYLVYGITPDFLKKNEKLYKKSLAQIKKLINAQGGLFLQAHPFRQVCVPVSKRLVDGIEVFNGHFNHDSQNAKAHKLGEKYGKLMLSGSDCHYAADVANGGIIFESEPQTDNFALALKEIPFTRIESEPQWLRVILGNDNSDTAVIEAAARDGAAQAVVMYKTDKKIEVTNIPVIYLGDEKKILRVGRCQIATQAALSEIDSTDPSVLLCESLSEELHEEAMDHHVTLVLAQKGDDTQPYIDDDSTFMGFDMLKNDSLALSAYVMGPTVNISELAY